MFEFLKNIDYILVKILNDIENSITIKNGYTLVTIQSYCEILLKYVNQQEKIINQSKISLGEFLSNKKFIDIIEQDLSVDIMQLMRINNIANDIKHEGKSNFDKKEIEGSYKYIYLLSAKINNYYNNPKVEIQYDSTRFENLLAKEEEQRQILLEKIKENQPANVERIKDKLTEVEFQKEMLEQRIKEAENENKDYKEQLKKLTELEIELNEKDLLLQDARSEKAKLEQQINESNTKQKEVYESTIKELKKETKELQEQIVELRNSGTLDVIEKLDRDKKILSEKELEIEELKNELKAILEKDKTIQNEKIFDLYRKTSLHLGFSSSYVEDDNCFVINGVYRDVTSTSKYKSFYAVLNNLLQRGEKITQSKTLKQHNLEDNDLKEIIRLQMCILSLLRNGKLKDNYWNINYIEGNKKNLEIAIKDIFSWLKLITSLAHIEFIEPELTITNEDFKQDFINIKYDNKLELEKNIYTICDQIVMADEDTDDYFNIWIDDYIQYEISDANKKQLTEFMELVFGFNSFNDGQYEILVHTLNGNSTIGILPTGGGKSLIYQLSSLLEPKITIVVDPINSLIKDQIDGLKRKFGITRCLNITSSNDDKQKDEQKLRKSNAMFVFTSPERFQNEVFRKILLNLSFNRSIERIVLDEVHCLSEWGHDFRISYLMLAQTLINYCGSTVKYLGLTATAASNVIRDLIVELNLKEDDIIFLKKLRRKNLTFHIKQYPERNSFKQALFTTIKNVNPKLNKEHTNAVIVFARTVGSKNSVEPTCVENILNFLNPLYEDIIDRYDGKHKDSQDAFINNEKSLLVATKAFGMGIDKPNIRSTIHFGIPSSFESFYQEAGRAGRDRLPANCYLFTYETPKVFQDYVDKFFDPNTPINTLKNIQEKTARQIDLSSNFWFLTHDLDTPEEETKRTLAVYEVLKNGYNNKVAYLKDDEYWSKEKLLYILHKIGIVLNWEKNYTSQSYSVYLSSFHSDIDHIKNEAKKYVSQYKDDTNTISKIEDIKNLNQLNELIVLIRRWYHDKFVQGRRNQLANMYDKVRKFANKDASSEIQAEIDSYFDLTNIIYKSNEGYTLTFDNDSITDVIEHISELEDSKVSKRCIEMERVLESNTTNNINLYTSLLFLKNNQFNSRNGKQRFEAMYNNVDEVSKTEIYETIAKKFYNQISKEQKEELIDFLYHLDRKLLRTVFLENVKEDSITKKYWIPFINEQLKEIIKGGK